MRLPEEYKTPLLISCPKGSYALYEENSILTICLIDILGLDTTVRIIEAVNTILDRDRTRFWSYCIYIGPNTLATPGSEDKFVEFSSFRKWLGTLLDRKCYVAIVTDESTPKISHEQVKRSLTKAEVTSKTFNNKEDAYMWIESKVRS
jgi:hypothetical protein